MSSVNKWDKAYMQTAEIFADLSTAQRLKVGAIVVKNNRIISIGYNGMPSGWDNVCEHEGKTKPEVIHAEANAIAKLARSSESGEGSDMYITHAPCLDCAKQIYAAGISNVFFKTHYRSTAGIEFLHKCNVGVIILDV